MDFSLDPELARLRGRAREFVNEILMPVESDRTSWDEHENIRLDRLAELQAKAMAAGLWAPQTPRELAGMGLSRVGMAVMYEEANRSIFGPVVFNAAAPDDGNMMLLAKVGTAAQQSRWLRPIVEGRVRSAFAMTEPAPGGGSDPGMIRTRATRRGGRWVIEGRKWFITGAGVAQHFIVIARTSNDPRRGLTAFLFDRDQPGWEIVRRIPIMGPEEHGGHCELVFTGLEIADENLLLGVGDGLKITQIRPGPGPPPRARQLAWPSTRPALVEYRRGGAARWRRHSGELATHLPARFVPGCGDPMLRFATQCGRHDCLQPQPCCGVRAARRRPCRWCPGADADRLL
jgi:acyl-CoA dehydrogenase